MSIDGGGNQLRGAPPRQSFPPGASWLGVAFIAAVVLLASSIAVLPSFKTQTVAQQSAQGGGAGPAGPAGVNPSGGTTTTTTGGGGGGAGGGAGGTNGNQINPSSVQCASGKNGGSTDVGVSATSIRLASTVVESGIGESFLGDVRYGMIAVANQVNAAGGVCGRRLDLQHNLLDDGWSATTGQQDIRNFIAQGVFALPVVPSSQGLDQAARAGDIDSAPDTQDGGNGIPVVGTDGMLYTQYADPWIWPVASSTISTAHIAAKSAYDAGSRRFGVVYDKSYKFGPEGAAAFKGEVERLGGTVPAYVGINAGEQDYSSFGSSFNAGCGSTAGNPGCDMVFVLLEPSTAETWFGTSGMVNGKKLTEGPQPLFVDTFGQNCGEACNNMVVWTSYYPPRTPFNNVPAVAKYVSAVQGVSSSADIDNQFLEGGYDGMLLFVDALQNVGADLTRQRLKAALNSTSFDSGLTKPLSWHEGNHYANTSMLEFKIQYSQGFNGFQYQNSDWVTDPCPSCDKPSQ
jgi:ABC-type branched-subunit amino acid transport system substrate-binding protein